MGSFCFYRRIIIFIINYVGTIYIINRLFTVGPDYGHAEARKSPTVDGKVQRNPDGKEVRFPVILTCREKEIARRIVVVFRQQVCGFELLRVQEGDSVVSYVCDVNGWSFVKNSRKYYDDCAQILTEHMLAAVKPKALMGFSALDPLMATMEDADSINPNDNTTSSSDNNNTANNNTNVVGNTILARAKRVFQLEPATTPTTVTAVTNTNTASPPDTVIAVAAAVTLDDGALPVRDFPSTFETQQNDSNSNNGNTTSEPFPSSCLTVTTTNDNDNMIANSNSVNSASATNSNARSTHQEELRCVISIVRYGERTPKQRLKVHTTEPLVLEYFHTYCKHPKKDLKVKDKNPMIQFLAFDTMWIGGKMGCGIEDSWTVSSL